MSEEYKSTSHWGLYQDAIRLDSITCPVAKKVVLMVASRAEVGLKKYGQTMRRDDYDLKKMMQMAVEELLDGAVYLTRAIELMEQE